MPGQTIITALLSRPSLIRNVGEVKVKQLMFAAMMRPDGDDNAGGAGPSFCSFRGAGPAAGAGETEAEGAT